MNRPVNLGFTLIEVLVALSIVAITLSAGLRVSGGQINQVQRAADMLRAQLCAENELVKLRLLRQLPDTGDQPFVCEQAGASLTGRLEIKPTPNPSFRKVDSLVFLANGENKEATVLLRLSTLVGRF